MRRASWGLLLGLLAAGTAAGQGDKGTVVELDGLKSRAPAEWKEKEVSDMQKRMGRIRHFIVPGGGKDDAEVFIFYFQGQGGSTQDNLKRYKGMFVPPQGKSIDDVTEVKEMKVGSVPVTYVDVHGTYKFKKAPIIPDEQAELRPNYRMIAVIFNSKNGPYYVRFVGPEKTVAQHKDAFDNWLKSFQ